MIAFVSRVNRSARRISEQGPSDVPAVRAYPAVRLEFQLQRHLARVEFVGGAEYLDAFVIARSSHRQREACPRFLPRLEAHFLVTFHEPIEHHFARVVGGVSRNPIRSKLEMSLVMIGPQWTRFLQVGADAGSLLDDGRDWIEVRASGPLLLSERRPTVRRILTGRLDNCQSCDLVIRPASRNE